MKREQLYEALSTNLKGPMRSYKLGRLTAVLGPIRAGKTSVVDSVRFAHTGIAGGYKADALIAAQTESGVLRVRLQGKNGEIDATGPAKAGPNSSKLTRPVVLLPDGDWLEGKAMRSAIAKRFAKSISLDPPPDLSETQAVLWKKKVEDAAVNSSSPAETLSIAAKSFDSVAREQNKIVNTKKKEIDAAAGDLTIRSDPKQLEADYQRAVQAEAWTSMTSTRSAIDADIKKLEADLATAQAELDIAHAILEARTGDAAELTKLDLALLTAQNHVAIASAMLSAFNIPGLDLSCCPLCGAQGPCRACNAEGDLAKKQEDLRKFAAAAQTQWPLIIAEKAKLTNERQACVQRITQCASARDTVDTQLKGKKDTLSKLPTAAPDPWTGLSSAMIEQAMAAARGSQKALGRLEEKKAARDIAERAATDAESCKHVAAREMKRVVKEVESEASSMFAANMPSGFEAELVVNDKEAELRLAGRDGKFRSKEALSGSERAVARIAMRIATAEADKARLVLLDDEDWASLGADGQEAMCQMLETADIDQAVVASSVLTASDLSDKWTTIVLAPSVSAPAGSIMAQLAVSPS